MPKVVDATERLALIHDATIRLIVTGGVAHASLRNVAAEAGLNIGSVRHYVGSTGNLLRGVVEAMSQAVTDRLESYDIAVLQQLGPQESFELAVDMLCELIPLDDQRRTEAAVWLALLEHSRVHGDLGGAFDYMASGIRILTTGILTAAGVRDPELPAEALACALDGLVVAMVAAPEHYSPEFAKNLVRWQLRQAVAGTGRP